MSVLHHRWITVTCLLNALCLLSPSQLAAQNLGFAKTPTVTEYDVDPNWPPIPKEIGTKGWVSGIAVDGKDQVWFFKKGTDPVQVYTAGGEFVRSWGHGMFENPHHLRIDHEGNIWVCGSSPHWWLRNGSYPEYKDQVFMRFSNDGRLLQMWQIPLGDIGDDKNNPDVSCLQPGEAVGVHCIATDSAGNLYVGEIYSERAQKFVPVTRRPAEDQPEGEAPK